MSAAAGSTGEPPPRPEVIRAIVDALQSLDPVPLDTISAPITVAELLLAHALFVDEFEAAATPDPNEET